MVVPDHYLARGAATAQVTKGLVEASTALATISEASAIEKLKSLPGVSLDIDAPLEVVGDTY